MPSPTYVPVDLQPCLDAAQAYLVATLAWSSAGDVLAATLNNAVHQYPRHPAEATAFARRHVNKLREFVRVQRQASAMLHHSSVVDAFAEQVILPLDEMKCVRVLEYF
jgi:hypothetical protein